MTGSVWVAVDWQLRWLQSGWLPVAVTGALGLSAALALAIWMWPHRPRWNAWVAERRSHRLTPVAALGGARRGPLARLESVLGRSAPVGLRMQLGGQLERAGIDSTPERVLVDQLLIVLGAGVVFAILAVDGMLPYPMAALIVLLLPVLGGLRILRAASARRAAAVAQLPILVDLMVLEQSGGGVGARRAMELVVARVSGEAAAVLRGCLTSSAAASSPPLDRQLEQAGERMQISALSALAAVIRMQREEGISAGSPLGSLARGLRDKQRDELIARGRRALVSMLLPVALCILLPFILIILYPALERLAGALS
jgi:Flp pilus assembly protein TadB